MSPLAPSSTLSVSELFESIQGEGPSSGIPCMILRLAGCNLRCTFCDTPYSWDFRGIDPKDRPETMSVEAVATSVVCSTHLLLVITGGEPLLQQQGLEQLVARLPQALAIEVETNGTLVPSTALLERVSAWNISPKLGNSGESLEARWNLEALRVLRDTERAWLKFVIGTPKDLEEADGCFRMWGWRRDRVVLMPQATTRAEIAARGPWIAQACVRRDWRYSPRLQVDLWEGERGV